MRNQQQNRESVTGKAPIGGTPSGHFGVSKASKQFEAWYRLEQLTISLSIALAVIASVTLIGYLMISLGAVNITSVGPLGGSSAAQLYSSLTISTTADPASSSIAVQEGYVLEVAARETRQGIFRTLVPQQLDGTRLTYSNVTAVHGYNGQINPINLEAAKARWPASKNPLEFVIQPGGYLEAGPNLLQLSYSVKLEPSKRRATTSSTSSTKQPHALTVYLTGELPTGVGVVGIEHRPGAVPDLEKRNYAARIAQYRMVEGAKVGKPDGSNAPTSVAIAGKVLQAVNSWQGSLELRPLAKASETPAPAAGFEYVVQFPVLHNIAAGSVLMLEERYDE